MNKRYGILIVSVTILVLCFAGTASATNWSVDASGGADFTGIQDAINKAKEGDTIMVHSGVYYENVVVDKLVTLKGINLPVVDAGGEGSAITLTADGITLVGFTATNSGILFEIAAGIMVTSNNNSITGNNACNNGEGIRLTYSSNNNTISGNNVNNNLDGISLYDSSNNIITGNTLVNDGLFISYSYQNTVEENIVNGKPLVYLEDALDYKVEDAGQVILVNCNNITVENLVLSDTYVGVTLLKTKNSRISNNTVCNNGYYISLRNIACMDGYGIYLRDSSNNTITGNNVSNNNNDGIALGHSGNNTITGNNVNNNLDGISLSSSSNNKIYLNNFIDNTYYNVHSDSTNIWNSPLEITYTYDETTYESYLGNYWEDYEGDYEGIDADGDGIGDSSYSIDSEKDESDDYPLMKPFENYIIPSLAHTQPHTTGFELLFAIIGVVAAVYLIRQKG